MRQPPRRLFLDALLVPVRVLRRKMAGDHAPGGREHVARDLQALGSGHGPEDLGHVVVQHLEAPGIDGHGVLENRISAPELARRLSPPGSKSPAERFYKITAFVLPRRPAAVTFEWSDGSRIFIRDEEDPPCRGGSPQEVP